MSGELGNKLKASGIDLELYRKVAQLEDLEKLLKQGKVKKEVYQQIFDDVIRLQKKKDDENRKKNPFARIANLVGRKGTASNPVSSPKPSKPVAAAPSKPIIEDELLIQGHNKSGKPVWKKVFVVLLEDSIVYYKNKNDPKPLRTIGLTADFFVSEVRGGVLQRANTAKSADDIDEDKMSVSTTQSDDIIDQPNLFLVSNLRDKYYFAAEDEVKKQYWVMMSTTVIRDLLQKQTAAGNQGGDGSSGQTFIRSTVDHRTPEQIAKDYEERKQAYVKSQMRRTMRPSMNGTNRMAQDELIKNETKWARQGERIARQSIAIDLMTAEKERAQYDVKEQEALRRELQDKERALKQMQTKLEHSEEQWQRKYDDLLEKFRQQALARHEEKLEEEKRIRQQLHTLKRMSVHPMSDKGRDYEQEIEMYKTKLKALQAALKVDIENLDWDGTLEDAEAKMKLLVDDLMSDNPDVQREAQNKFDQWDQIIRNHADYLNRETKKWESWEEENFEKNLDALNEMRQLCPQIYYDGCSEKELMEATGIAAKTAARIKKNNIFRFFWMDKDQIAKIHIADLLNKYASQGLDLRELRAVYATLPDEFQLDSDGRKRQFRENIRNRLAELSKKEAAGTITATEQLNNAYRSNEIQEAKPKIAAGAGGVRKPPGANKNMKNKALALEAMLKKKGNGPPPEVSKEPSKESAAATSTIANKLDPNAPEWEPYFKMKKAGLPDGAIMNRIQKDGKDPNTWFKIVELSEKGASSAPSSAPAASKLDPNSPEWEPYFKMKKAGLPDGAILNKIQKDGKDQGTWFKIVELSEKGGSSTPAALGGEEKRSRAGSNAKTVQHVEPPVAVNPTPKPRKNSAPKEPTAANTQSDDLKAAAMKFIKKAKDENQKSSSSLGGDEIPGNMQEIRRKKKLKPKAAKRREGSLASVATNETDENDHDTSLDHNPHKKTKKTLKNQRRTTRAKKSETGNHLLMGDANDLLKKAKMDTDVTAMKRGSHGIGNLEYGSTMKATKVEPEGLTKSQQRAAKMGNSIEESLQELTDIIVSDGEFDKVEGGIKTMKFGDLFLRYEKINDMLVGLLMKGKRQGMLKYRGDMLFKGIHDEIKITVLTQ